MTDCAQCGFYVIFVCGWYGICHIHSTLDGAITLPYGRNKFRNCAHLDTKAHW